MAVTPTVHLLLKTEPCALHKDQPPQPRINTLDPASVEGPPAWQYELVVPELDLV